MDKISFGREGFVGLLIACLKTNLSDFWDVKPDLEVPPGIDAAGTLNGEEQIIWRWWKHHEELAKVYRERRGTKFEEEDNMATMSMHASLAKMFEHILLCSVWHNNPSLRADVRVPSYSKDWKVFFPYS